ncbi:MAG: hypothetical protein JNK45_10860 [Myxococcales bacterium]|nr:hypothetical protein [Myxococcales bacterium]
MPNTMPQQDQSSIGAHEPRPAAHRRPSRLALGLVALAFTGVSATACKKDEPKVETAKTETKDGKTGEAKKDAPPTGDTGTKVEPAKPGDPISPADALQPPASALQRGDVLGHVLFANPSTLLREIKTQVAPEAQAAFVDEAFLRTAAGSVLGPRSKLATNLDLAKPLGCALVDLTAAPVPVVCVMGYTGGSAALVADLGAEGKQADAAGHVAKFVVEGQELYVDDAGGEVVVSNHADAFAKGKSYLEANLIGRGGALASDIEFVAFPAALSKRYEKELAPLLEVMGKVPPPSGGGAFADAMAAYSVKANARNIETIRGMDQLTVAFGLEPAGFVARFAMFPAPGSDLEAQAKLSAAGPLEIDFARNLPKTSWLAAAFNANIAEAMDAPMTKELRNVFIDAYVQALGKDKAATEAAVDTFMQESKATYTGHSAFAVMHEPGTLGGVAVISGVKEGVVAREAWKTWATGFTPEAIIGAEAAKKVTWAFQFDAAKAGDVAIDRFVIEPTDAEKAKLRADGGPKLAEWETKLGGLKLSVNRIETKGRVAWVIAPGSDDKYAQLVVDALGGTNALVGDPGLTRLLDRNPGASAIFAVDVKGMMSWLGDIVPPEEKAKLPTVGNDLGDVVFAQSYGSTGAQSGEVVLSQALIDQIRALAK